jgi:hypothetical protein
VSDKVRSNEVFEIEPAEPGGLLAHLPWWLILAVAFVVTELTAHPAIGVSVLCLKFGWNDFRTAIWLRRRDPDRKRGATCGWFYMASGLWRVCLWSFGLMFAAILFIVALDPPQPGRRGAQNDPDLPPEVMTCMVMWLTSFASATLLTGTSILLAWRRRVKVWISASISESRRRDEWPPRPLPRARPERNLLRAWTIGTGLGAFVICFVLGMIGLASLVGFVRAGNNPRAGAAFAVGIGVAIPIAAAFFCLTVAGLILNRTGASSPVDCWPAEQLEVSSDSTD